MLTLTRPLAFIVCSLRVAASCVMMLQALTTLRMKVPLDPLGFLGQQVPEDQVDPLVQPDPKVSQS